MGTFLYMICFDYNVDKLKNKHIHSILCNSVLSLCILTTVCKMNHTELYIVVSYSGLLPVPQRTKTVTQDNLHLRHELSFPQSILLYDSRRMISIDAKRYSLFKVVYS